MMRFKSTVFSNSARPGAMKVKMRTIWAEKIIPSVTTAASTAAKLQNSRLANSHRRAPGAAFPLAM